MRAKPTFCIDYFQKIRKGKHPPIFFAGEFIDLPMLVIYSHTSKGFISKVFSGQKTPTIPTCIRIALALGMPLGDFVEALVEHTLGRHERAIDAVTLLYKEYVAKFPSKHAPPKTNPTTP